MTSGHCPSIVFQQHGEIFTKSRQLSFINIKAFKFNPQMNYLQGVQIWTHATLMRDGASETGDAISICFEESRLGRSYTD